MGDSHFVCIGCGSPAAEIYHSYGGGITKISHCEKCSQIVDKYVEYDAVIVFLDCLLLKIQAFRHVLHNTKIKNEWKLTFLFLLCDAYCELQQRRSNATYDSLYLLYSALESDLYVMFLVVSCELLVCTSVILALLKLNRCLSSPRDTRATLRALLLSNFGKLFVIPAMLWSKPYSHVYQSLIRLFVLLSNVQALRAYGQHRRLPSLLISCTGHACQFCASYVLHSALQTTTLP